MNLDRLRPFLVIAAISPLFLTISCKNKVSLTKSGYIINENNIELFKPEENHKDYIKLAKSTPLIATLLANGNRKFCSGVLVKPEENDPDKSPRVLSNFHCFAKTDKKKVILDQFLNEACINTSVYFDFNASDPDRAHKTSCLEGTLKGDFVSDLAVIKLSNPLPKDYPPLEFWDDDQIPEGKTATIIHYPDIKENFVKINNSKLELPAAAITETDCNIIGDFPKDEWSLDPVLAFSVKHNCDLIHGSSGSALIDRESKKILGINWGGIEITSKNQYSKNNAATKTTYIKAFLNGELESIKEQTRQEAYGADLVVRKNAKSKKVQRLLGQEVPESCGVISTNGGSKVAYLLYLLIFIPTLAVIARSAILMRR